MSVKMLSNQIVLSKGWVYYVLLIQPKTAWGPFSWPFPFSSRQCAWNVKF